MTARHATPISTSRSSPVSSRRETGRRAAKYRTISETVAMSGRIEAEADAVRSMPRIRCSAAVRVGMTMSRSRASSGDPWVASDVAASRNAWTLPTLTRRVTRGVITAASAAPSVYAFRSAPSTASSVRPRRQTMPPRPPRSRR